MAAKTSKAINTDITSENKKKALDTALAQIEKKYGEGAIMRLGNNGLNIEAVSTGSIALDAAVGIGGLPKGRIIEIYGPESSGKTTLALHAVAEVQKAGGEAAFVDAEHALDPVYAAALGVDVDSLLVSQPDYGEQAIEIVEALARSGALDIIVVDSVAALVPKAEIDGEMGDSTMGSHARLMSKAMRKLTGVISKTNTIIIFINQLREKVGVIFGNPETTTGGRALKFYATIRMEVRRSETLKGANGEFVGAHTKVKVVKNKVAPPFKTAEFDIMFGEGISHESELLDMGVELDVVRKSGAFFYYNEERIGQGRENAKTYLKDNPEIAAEIETKIRAKIDEQKANQASDNDDLSDDVVTYRPVATTKDAARAKIDVIVDDDE
ncbi:MAG: recombinase RecA [Clostridia bacterium]|nr:recombinase RecA [Clostridia bacterium]HAQ63425.1 recombinase RecA [Oscillospiraceae bacterium]